MKNNKLLIGLGALVIVVLLIVVSEKLSNSKPSSKSLKFFPTATEKSISAVLIQDNQDTVKIFKKGDVWMVGAKSGEQKASAGPTMAAAPVGEASPLAAHSPAKLPAPAATPAAAPAGSAPVVISRDYPADSAALAAMLEKIAGMKKETEISDNPAKQSLYEVDSLKGVYIEVWDNAGKSLGSLRIGKSGADWSSHFVRAIGSNQVYAVSGGVRYAFFTERKRWRDHTILKFDRNTAKRISLQKRDGTLISLAKSADTGSTWSILMPVNSPAKSDQMNEMLEKLALFTAADFQDTLLPDSVMGLATPELTVTVNLGGDTNKKVYIGKQNTATKNFYVKADGKDIVFLVSEFDVQKLDKNVDGLKAVPPADSAKAAPPAAAVKPAATAATAAKTKPPAVTPAPAKK